MDIRSILSTTPPRGSHSPESSSGYSASNPQPIAELTSAVTPSINSHSTTAMTERPVLDLDRTAERALPYEGFDDMYDDSRHNSPKANADPGKGLSDPPPFQESNVCSEPLISSANSQLVATEPAAPTSGASVHRTIPRNFSDACSPALPSPKRDSPLDYGPSDRTTPATSSIISVHEWTPMIDEPQYITPWPTTTSPVASLRPETTARSSSWIPNNASDAWTARPNAAVRNSNRIPDGAEIHDVDAWEAQQRIQVTHQPSDLSPQASSRTLSGSEQTAVDFLAPNSHSRDISQGPSGSKRGSNAKYENGSPLQGPELESPLFIDIETAIREKTDVPLGAALLCRFSKDCHKQEEIRMGKQKEGDAPLSPLFPSVGINSTIETSSSDGNEAYLEQTLTSNGTVVQTVKAHPGNAVWPLVQSRLGSANDSRIWETACHNCSTIIDSRMGHYCKSCTEQREQTIPPEEAAVDDRSRSKVMRQANGNVNSYANGTQTRPSPPPLPLSHPSHRTRPSTASARALPGSSLRRRSQRGRAFGRISPSTPDQVQDFNNNETKEANNADYEQGWRDGKKKKRSVSWDSKANGQASSKREAIIAVEDLGGGRVRARARRQKLSDSSNEANESGPSEGSHRFAASGTSVAGRGTGFGAGTSSSGTNLTAPDPVAAHAPDPVTYPTSPATLASPRRENSSGTRVRLTLTVAAEANPEHADHEAYLARMEVRRRMQRE